MIDILQKLGELEALIQIKHLPGRHNQYQHTPHKYTQSAGVEPVETLQRTLSGMRQDVGLAEGTSKRDIERAIVRLERELGERGVPATKRQMEK